MILEKLKIWTVEGLWTDLSFRNKNSEKDFETIVYRLALFFSFCKFFLVYLE